MRSGKRVAFAVAALFVALSLVGLAGSERSSAAKAGGGVPLVDSLGRMEPRSVWQNFYQLTRIPRPSHHEQKATSFVARFGRKLGLKTIVDAAGNVIIRKPASVGMERRPAVVLQAHLDMVAQTRNESINLKKDPVTAILEDGWVHAEGTTLGADDGIGVAIILAILQADDVGHGPLEALFTVDEEDGMTGINALSRDVLKGRLYINVDNEVEGTFLISSAGGVNVEIRKAYRERSTPCSMVARQITIDGLRGGHSGIDINKGRASAHQLLGRLLVNAPARFDVRLAKLVGGKLRNAIPRRATALVALRRSYADAFGKYVHDFGKKVAAKLAKTDPRVQARVKPVRLPAKTMRTTAQRSLIRAVYKAPQGVYAMSKDVPRLVETSGNLGILRIGDGDFTASALARSAIDTERDAEARRFGDVFKRAGAKVKFGQAYASWPPKPDSPLLARMKQVYQDSFGHPATVSAVHAGLETSVVGVKYPGMDMISVGPTLKNVHSPDERLEAASVPKVYDLLVATLRPLD